MTGINIEEGRRRVKGILAMVLLAAALFFPPLIHAGEDSAWLGVGISFSKELDTFQGEIFVEEDGWFPFNAGFSILVNTSHVYGGIDVRKRLIVPSWISPVSPFIGAGIFAGWWKHEGVDEAGEETEERDMALAVYPEAGLHVRLGGKRLTCHARYYVTTMGRKSDRIMYGITLGF
jgi:hypothetical protein